MSKRKRTPIAQMHPRERLTDKARAGISKYATHKAGDLPIHHFMVDYVLEAERMPRKRLYSFLEENGYRWKPRIGLWMKK